MFTSIRSRLLYSLMGSVLLITLIIAWISFYQAQSLVQANRAELLGQLAQSMAFQLNKDMQSRGNEIQMLTSLSDIKNPDIPLTQKRAIFERMRKAYPYYAWIGMTDAQGNILAGTDNLLVGKNVGQRSWFLQGSQGLHLGSVHDAFLLAKIMPKPKWDDLPLRLVDVSAPIRDDHGQLLGVICGHLGWDWAFEMRHKMLSSASLSNVNLMVAKTDGSLLMGTNKLPSGAFNLHGLQAFDQAILSKDQGVAIDHWPDNQAYMTAVVYEQTPENEMLQWTVVAQEKMQDILEVSDVLKAKVIGLLFIMMLFLWFLVWRIVSSKTEALEALTQAANAIQNGSTDVSIPTYERQDEVGVLSNSISVLINNLQNEIRQKSLVAHELQLMARVYEDSPQGIMITDAESRILNVNQAFTTLTGYSAEEVLGKTPSILRSGRQDKPFYHAMWQALYSNGRWQGEIWNRNKKGDIYPEWLMISTLKNPQQEITHYIAIFSDITDKKQAEQQLIYLANHDVLTQLPNRRLLQDTINLFIYSAAKASEPPLAGLIFLDLDFFKNINDSLGHLVGDQFLKEIGHVLRQQFQAPNLIARFGGDEFVIFMPNIPNAGSLEAQAQVLLNRFQQPFRVGDYSIQIGLTMGMSLYPMDGLDADALIQAADTAMYDIKHKHTQSYQFYSQTMREAAYEKLSLEADLKSALANQEFFLVYQPQISNVTGKLTGFESLIRWQHPVRGLVSPMKFIPALEEMGLIESVGLWVVRAALTQYQHWSSRYDFDGVTISINLSAVQLRNPQLTEILHAELQAIGIKGNSVVFEVTESVMIEDDRRIIEEFTTLKQTGCQFALDDYGTGYSNLGYIDKFNLSILKIDKCFVDKLQTEPVDRLIIHHTIEMARALGMKVVIEGVETAEQMVLLQQYPEVVIQGYYFDRPLTADLVESRLAQRSDLIWQPASKQQ